LTGLRYTAPLAGDEVPIRGDMLRSSGLELLGGGIGSVAIQQLVAGAGELLAAAPAAGVDAPCRSVPLSAVANVWNGDGNVRLVFSTRV
jgi:hypothetical protein